MRALLCLAPLAWMAPALQDPDPFAPFVAPASKEGEQAMARFQLPAGWKVELVAAEPSLANPVCFAFDHDGKTIYVGETFRHHKGVTDIRDHMDWNDDDLAARTVEDRVAYFKKHLGDKFADYEKACERVRKLTDADGDGVFEGASVFSDRFRDAAAGIGASLLSYRGDVFYTCIPSLWKLRDEDGDGRADKELELSTGYGVHVALLGHDLHGLRVGPDGKLYFSIGDRGFNVPLPDGKRIEYPESGAVLRCNLDGSDLEVFAMGLRNPQDLIFDAWGNLFTGDNNSDGGDRARLVHVVEGSDSGWRQAYQWINEPDVRGPWNDEKLWHPYPENQAAYVLPPIANLCDGPSGITIDPGTGFPAKYAGWFFLADFRGTATNSGVRGFELVPKGAGFALGRHEQTWWSVLATDVEVGADGALYVLDWVEGWNQTGKGRIYRAYDPAARDAQPAREVKRLLAVGFDQRGSAELVRLLAHADQRVRQEAQFALARRGQTSQAALEAVANASPSRLARVHAIWGLGMVLREPGASGVERLVALLGDADGEIRAQAARGLGDLRASSASAALAECLKDPEPRVRMFAAIGLSRIRASGVGPPLIEYAAAAHVDPVLRHTASLAMSTCMQPEELAALSAHASEAVRIAAVVALRRAESALVERFLDDQSLAVALEAARAIYDTPIPGALAALASKEPAFDAPYALVRRYLNARFRLGGSWNAFRLVTFATITEYPLKLRKEALSVLARWSRPPDRDPVVGAWRPMTGRDARMDGAHVKGISELELSTLTFAFQAHPELAQAWVDVCVANDLPGASEALTTWATNTTLPGSTRAAAIRGLSRLDAPQLPAVIHIVIASPDHDVRAVAIEQLPRIDPKQALTLAGTVLREGELREQRAALRALSKIPGPGASKLLAQLLDLQTAGLLAPDLALDLALAAETSGEAQVTTRLAALRAPREVEPLLAPYVDSLYGGNAERGRKIFREKSELACLRCHLIEAGEGGEVGPDLRGLGARSTRLRMLESLCDPNRTIAEGFRNTILFLKDETHLEGRVVTDGPVVLQLIDAQAKLHEVPVEEIDERRQGMSAMPTDLTKHISREEMRDLIEFLTRL